MKSIELLSAIGEVRNEYIQDILISAHPMQSKTVPGKRGTDVKKAPRVRPLRRPLLIAALIALMLLLVGCAVVYMLRIQDMKVAEETYSRESYVTPDGETVPATQWVTTLFSLQGYNDSNCQLAMKEWLPYTESYDPDGILMKENNLNESGLPDNYFLNYNCYTWEMKDKLDEILGKYDLKPLGAYVHCDWWENHILFDALQIRGILRENADAEVDRLVGYFTPEGTFDVEFKLTLTGADALWPDEMFASFRYSLTDYLDPLVGGVRNMETVDQWNYTTENGTQLLLVRDGDTSMILCDRGKAFITITVDDFTEDADLSPEALEQFAEVFDYSVSPHPANMEQVEQMLAASEEPYNPAVHGYYIGFIVGSNGTFHPPEGYDDSIESYLSYVTEHADPEDQYYALADVDSDGADELLLGRGDGQLKEVVKMGNGEVTIRFATYLCAGNVLERYSINDTYVSSDDVGKDVSYQYSTLSEWIVTLYYLPESDRWIKVTGDGKEDEVITALEARQIKEMYPRLELDMKPLSEFPIA